MNRKKFRILTAACGILGTAALIAYNAEPFTFMPLPPANASAAQVTAFGSQYHDAVIWDTWFQATGAVLSVVFASALVHMAGAATKFAGKLTQLAGTVLIVLALAEGTFALGALQAGAGGHPEGAVMCVDIINAFIHVFTIAPSLFLMLGVALIGTRLLPPAFNYSALALGIAFQTLGFAGLFDSSALIVSLVILGLQLVWTLAASVTLPRLVEDDPGVHWDRLAGDGVAASEGHDLGGDVFEPGRAA